MEPEVMKDIAPHYNPVRQCDSLVISDLAPRGMPGRFEQFWALRIAENVFEISCIPFFAYGIALGDKVRVNGDCLIEEIIERSGHNSLRLAIADSIDQNKLHRKLHDWVEKSGLLYEWYSPGYLAVDIPPSAQARIDTLFLDELSQAGEIFIEAGE
jgi:hypothetical protein